MKLAVAGMTLLVLSMALSALAQDFVKEGGTERERVPVQRMSAAGAIQGRGVLSFEAVSRHGKLVYHAILSNGQNFADVIFDRNGASFSDGYSIEFSTLSEDVSRRVSVIRANSPDGRTQSEIVTFDKVKVTSSSSVSAGTYSLLNESTQFAVARVMLPLLLTGKNGLSDSSVGEVHMETPRQQVDCAISTAFWISAGLGMVAACGVPEPLEPFACAAAVVAYTAAGANMAVVCGDMPTQ